MNYRILLSVTFFLLSFVNVSCSQPKDESMKQTNNHPVVLIKTNVGDIRVELNAEKAPISVKNFLEYVNKGHYNNTIFHRVIDGFMIQGGGFTKDFKQKPTNAAIQNEADNGLKNLRGTLAMARTSDVNSATAQFFINVVDNHFLDFRAKNPREYGYTVFGEVTEGMDIVDKIKKAKTGSFGPYQDVPVETVEIIEAKQIH